MKLPKIKWRVQPAPTGRYRSFDRRGWPSAEYSDGQLAASIRCEDAYYPAHAKTGAHAPLTLVVYDYSKGTQERASRVLVKRFSTLEEAKAALLPALEKYPEFILKEEQYRSE